MADDEYAITTKQFPFVELTSVSISSANWLKELFQDLGRDPDVRAGGRWEDERGVPVEFSSWSKPHVLRWTRNGFVMKPVIGDEFIMKPTEWSYLEFA